MFGGLAVFAASRASRDNFREEDQDGQRNRGWAGNDSLCACIIEDHAVDSEVRHRKSLVKVMCDGTERRICLQVILLSPESTVGDRVGITTTLKCIVGLAAKRRFHRFGNLLTESGGRLPEKNFDAISYVSQINQKHV